METRITEIISEYAGQGAHHTGTDVDNNNADWLAECISSFGAKVDDSSFQFPRIRVHEAKFNLPELEIGGAPLFDCLYTDKGGLSGTIGALNSDADIGIAMGQDIHIARLENKHKAIVIVTDERLPKDGIATLNAEDFKKPFGPPVLQIPSQYWPEIQAAMKSEKTGRVTAFCDTTAATARNIGTLLKGKNPRLSPLVIMTPRSGWWSCASERGGGIACFLEMLRAIQQRGCERDVIFTANTGHELGHIGLDQYLDENPNLITNASMWIHLGANFAAKYNAGVRLQYSDTKAQALIQTSLKATGAKPASETEIGSRPFGEARNIHDGGGRYISILGQNGLFHHPADTWPDAVDLDATTRWVKTFVELGLKLSL